MSNFLVTLQQEFLPTLQLKFSFVKHNPIMSVFVTLGQEKQFFFLYPLRA